MPDPLMSGLQVAQRVRKVNELQVQPPEGPSSPNCICACQKVLACLVYCCKEATPIMQMCYA